MARSKHIIYIQYTNPGGYPPLEHSSRILADAGWQVLFLGTRAPGDPLRFPPHPNISVRYLSFWPGGWRQKLHYLYYCLWVLSRVVAWRPHWIYASDTLVSPAALVFSYFPWLRVLYHEHDSPGAPAGAFQRTLLRARTHLARRADCCVLPNRTRLERFLTETGTLRDLFCVWNCPAVQDAGQPRGPANRMLYLLYHGSIVPERLPITIVRALAALPDTVALRVIGYETIGSPGYIAMLRKEANRLGVGARLEVVGAVPRADLMPWCRRSDIGLSLLPLEAWDANQRTMTGASNKPFDYLACGLPFLMSDLPDWHVMYGEPGYGLACDPRDPQSIACAIRGLLENPDLMRSMGEKGRQRILADWNYETAFEPVRRRLEALPARAAAAYPVPTRTEP
ncbi:MAG: glycosyltransferase family 4 protein [Bryobacteraceae bacterium]